MTLKPVLNMGARMTDTKLGTDGDAPARARKTAPEADYASQARVGHLLRRGYHLARERSARLLAPFDITPRQSAALWEIWRRGSLSQAELGIAIGMEPANVHGLVSRLARKNYLVVARDPVDPRRMRLRLTPTGAVVAAQLPGVALAAEEATLEPLAPKERETLVRLLRKLVSATPV